MIALVTALFALLLAVLAALLALLASLFTPLGASTRAPVALDPDVAVAATLPAAVVPDVPRAIALPPAIHPHPLAAAARPSALDPDEAGARLDDDGARRRRLFIDLDVRHGDGHTDVTVGTDDASRRAGDQRRDECKATETIL